MLKSVSSITNAIGALNYKGTWDANANSPALTSSVGTKGDYYVVGTAGSTNLNGISNWGVGDLVTFNGSVWQRVEGGADLNGVNLSVSGTSTLSGLTASTALALDASKNVVSVVAPAFAAATAADVAATTATWTKVTYGTEKFDTNSNFASSRFTATVPGYYQINASAYFYPSANGQCQIAIYKNGASYLVGSVVPNSNQGPACVASAVIQMAATDYLEIYVFQNSGGNLDFGSGDFSGCFLRGA
jgi:hypothetical protein